MCIGPFAGNAVSRGANPAAVTEIRNRFAAQSSDPTRFLAATTIGGQQSAPSTVLTSGPRQSNLNRGGASLLGTR